MPAAGLKRRVVEAFLEVSHLTAPERNMNPPPQC